MKSHQSEESNQLKDYILEVCDAYNRGANAMEIARRLSGNLGNSTTLTLLAYDLQAGSYIANARANPTYHKKWCEQIASVLDTMLAIGDTFLEVGVGEATTLSGVLESLTHKSNRALGFDLSWSRCAHACRFLAERSLIADLFVGDLFSIPLADASIDVVYTSHSLEPNGGREREAISELVRIAKRAVVLIEPIFEFAVPEGQRRMKSHGYVTGLRDTAHTLGLKIVDYRPLPVYGNPLNPSGLLILEKYQDSVVNSDRGIRWQCPITRTALNKGADGFFAPQPGLLYPVLRGIPLLRGEHAVVASSWNLLKDDSNT